MKKIIKNILNYFGYSLIKKGTLQKYKEKFDPYKAQKDLLREEGDLCIFDVGAHYGETAVRYKNVFSSSRIFSFEPFNNSAKIFLRETNKYSDIKLFEQAFSNKMGEAKFFINASDATNSLLNSAITNSWVDDATKYNQTLTVKTDTIDNFCAINGINNIDILKLDVQGGEMLVLEGANHMLSSGKIKMIFTEVEFIEIYKDQPLFYQITDFLATYNYKLFGLYDTHYLENGQIAWCDAIFLKAK